MKTSKTANIGQLWPDVLFPYTDDYAQALTATEISKQTKIARRTVARYLNNFVSQNSIRYKKEGKNKKYYFDLDRWQTKMLLSLLEQHKALGFIQENPEICLALDGMLKKEPIVFGSQAKGTAIEESDIDVLILDTTDRKTREIARKQLKRINIHFIKSRTFEKLLKDKNVLAKEIIKKHVNLGNAEFFDICWRYYKNEL